jgi:hypothetical protein
MSHKPQENLVGKTLEKCRLVAKLGTGGMGAVYLAEHFGLGRKVAVKILPPDMSRDPEYVARFMREAATSGRLEHPNIVQVFDVGYAEDRHFIVMQYVDGESLSTYVENLGAMEPRDAAKVAAGVLRGLHHAHEQGVVHRDVKPDNVLLAKGDEPKLLDFGLAIETESALQLTKDGLVVGTPYYLSPEQARGQKATPRSDVYSAGILLYYLLTGKRPFSGATALAVLNKHIREVPVPPSTQNPKVPLPLSDIALKMMAKRPEERYASAGAAADDLDNFLADRPVQAKAVRPMPWLTTQVKILGGACAGFIVLVLILALAFRGGEAAPKASGGATPAAPAAGPAEIGSLDALLKFQLEHADAFDQYAEILRRYDNYITANGSTPHSERARERRDAFRADAEKRAQAIYEKAVREADPVARAQALDAFPRGLLDVTEAGRNARAERARLADQLRGRFASQRAELDRALESGDFDAARRLIEDLLRYADAPQKSALAALRDEIPERERASKDAALQKLRRDYTRVHGWFQQALVQRDSAAAYRQSADFLKAVKDESERRHAFVPGVNYGPLLEIVPDSTLKADKLGDIRMSMAAAWAGAKEQLAYEVLTDLQDALDMEWLLRRAGEGLQALSRGPAEVPLATFGGAGKISIGPSGLVFAAKGAPARPIVIPQLHPADLILFAAAAEGQTADQAFASNPPLVRAGAVGFLYSKAPDRWTGAAKWFEQAAALRVPGPARRIDQLRDLGRQQVREALALARKEVDEKRFDAARKSLADIESKAGEDPEIRRETGTLFAKILMADLKGAFDRKDWVTVKTLGIDLGRSYAGLYDEAAAAKMTRQALWASSRWTRAATDLKGDTWTWTDREKGAAPPAQDAQHEGLRMAAGKSIALNPARAKGVTGLWVQVRYNGDPAPGGAGIGYSAGTLTVSASRVTLAGSETPEAPLKKKLAKGEWIDLALIVDGGEVAAFVDGDPALGFRIAAGADPAFRLVAQGDVNFRAVQLRK